jgi:hypothetical protein
MQGAIAEKTRQLFRKYSLTWITRQVLQQHRCYRIAELRQARQWVYSIEEINSIVLLTCCSCFGNGMADLVLCAGFGENIAVSGQYLDLGAQS